LIIFYDTKVQTRVKKLTLQAVEHFKTIMENLHHGAHFKTNLCCMRYLNFWKYLQCKIFLVCFCNLILSAQDIPSWVYQLRQRVWFLPQGPNFLSQQMDLPLYQNYRKERTIVSPPSWKTTIFQTKNTINSKNKFFFEVLIF